MEIKRTRVKIKIVFVIFLFINTFFLFSVNIRFYDCDGSKLKNDSIVAQRKFRKIKKVMDTINKNNCLPKRWKDRINSFWNSNLKLKFQLSCNMSDCAEWDPRENHIVLPKYFSGNLKECGCEESTILHEFLHAMAWIPNTDEGHKKIRGCEVKCTKKIRSCIKYPPPIGKECDCKE